MNFSHYLPSRLLQKLSPRMLGIVVWCILFGTAALLTGFLYFKTTQHYQQIMREHIRDLSKVAARSIDISQHERLTSGTQAESALYREALLPLVNLHLANDKLDYVYTVRVNDSGEEHFVLDSTTDAGVFQRQVEEDRTVIPSDLLDPYPDSLFYQARDTLLAGDSYVFDEIYEDHFGSFITALSPLFSGDGGFIGYVGIDYNLEEYNTHISGFLAACVVTLLLAALISTILARLAIQLRSHSLKNIQQLMIVEDRLRREKERAEIANREKSEMLAIATHDLKNPLSAISGLSQIILATGRDNPALASEIEMIQSINDASNHMFEVVNGILLNETVEHSSTENRQVIVDFSQLCKDTLKQLGFEAERKAITLDTAIEPGLMVTGDSTKLDDAIANYISNAIKYSPEGSVVHVSLSNTDDSWLEFRVTDQGPGIAQDDQKKLFQKFSKLSSKPTGGETSTGLGLSIVKTVVESCHGKLGCDSEAGAGASFWLRLKIEKRVPDKSDQGPI